MTIDEAIEHAREVASEQKRRSGECVVNDNECDKFSNCIKCAEEHEQLAEWLEKLEQYLTIGTPEECRAAVEGQKEIKNKAVDEFAEKSMEQFTDFDLKHGYPTVTDCKVILRDIAEQMKGSAADE